MIVENIFAFLFLQMLFSIGLHKIPTKKKKKEKKGSVLLNARIFFYIIWSAIMNAQSFYACNLLLSDNGFSRSISGFDCAGHVFTFCSPLLLKFRGNISHQTLVSLFCTKNHSATTKTKQYTSVHRGTVKLGFGIQTGKRGSKNNIITHWKNVNT